MRLLSEPIIEKLRYLQPIDDFGNDIQQEKNVFWFFVGETTGNFYGHIPDTKEWYLIRDGSQPLKPNPKATKFFDEIKQEIDARRVKH